jgi:hypothetical protein
MQRQLRKERGRPDVRLFSARRDGARPAYYRLPDIRSKWSISRSPAKKVVAAAANLLAYVNFGIALGTLLLPGSLMLRGLLGRLFLFRLFGCDLLFSLHIGLALGTLGVRAGG